MKALGALALLVLALAAAPAAHAQSPTGLTLTFGPQAAPVPYSGTGTVPATVVVGCADILAALAAGDLTATVTIVPDAPPAWLTVSNNTVSMADPANVQNCASGGGAVTETLDVSLTVTPDAPGVVDHAVDLTASLADSTATATATFTVAYHVNYTVVPDVTFPLAVNGTDVSFNVVVTQASNARSMVMMEQLKVSAGTLSGPASEVYENDAGKPASKTFRFTYRPPATEWANATASFTAFGHYLLADGRAGDFDNGTVMTFAFTNAAPQDDGGDGKDSPAPAGVLLALGLVALAALVRRRA